MATTTETLTNGFDHQLKIGSPIKKFVQEPYEYQNSVPEYENGTIHEEQQPVNHSY